MSHHVDYEVVAETYDARYANNAYRGTLGTLEALIAARPNLRALEVGCGTGHWLSVMRQLGAQVAGLDASPAMLERARERGGDLELVVGSAEQLPWPDESFDLVLANNAVHHFPDPRRFIAEAHRVLRPDGRLVIIGLEPDAVLRWPIYEYFAGTRERDRERYPAAQQLQQWLQQAGFAHSESRPVEHITTRQCARTVLDRGLLHQQVTSQLSLLSSEAYRSGLLRIRDELDAAEDRGQQLWLETDLKLYGTFGVRR